MEIINLLKTNLILLFNLIRNNIVTIIVVIVTAVAFYIAVVITLSSLKKLKVSFFSYYPFDRFFPKSGKWSALYFLTVIVFLILLVFFMLQGSFYLSPA